LNCLIWSNSSFHKCYIPTTFISYCCPGMLNEVPNFTFKIWIRIRFAYIRYSNLRLKFIYFIYLLWKSYKSTHVKIKKRLKKTASYKPTTHTVIDNKINVCNAQRWNNTQATLVHYFHLVKSATHTINNTLMLFLLQCSMNIEHYKTCSQQK